MSAFRRSFVVSKTPPPAGVMTFILINLKILNQNHRIVSLMSSSVFRVMHCCHKIRGSLPESVMPFIDKSFKNWEISIHKLKTIVSFFSICFLNLILYIFEHFIKMSSKEISLLLILELSFPNLRLRDIFLFWLLTFFWD